MTQILAADHPRDAESRAAFLEFGQPITIGKDVWIGGGALILPGITIGDDAIVGAGAAVTRDVVPGQTVAVTPLDHYASRSLTKSARKNAARRLRRSSTTIFANTWRSFCASGGCSSG